MWQFEHQNEGMAQARVSWAENMGQSRLKAEQSNIKIGTSKQGEGGSKQGLPPTSVCQELTPSCPALPGVLFPRPFCNCFTFSPTPSLNSWVKSVPTFSLTWQSPFDSRSTLADPLSPWSHLLFNYLPNIARVRAPDITIFGQSQGQGIQCGQGGQDSQDCQGGQDGQGRLYRWS